MHALLFSLVLAGCFGKVSAMPKPACVSWIHRTATSSGAQVQARDLDYEYDEEAIAQVPSFRSPAIAVAAAT